MKRWLAVVLASSLAIVAGCDPQSGDDTELRAGPDARVVTHAVESGTPSAAGLAYLEAVARAHDEADRAGDPEARSAALRRGLALPVPAGLGEAEVLRLELATRLCETLGERPDGVVVALDILEPMLDPERSLPLDRASARALVTLGDLAVSAGDDTLAIGSYMRAIRVMSSLRRGARTMSKPHRQPSLRDIALAVVLGFATSCGPTGSTTTPTTTGGGGGTDPDPEGINEGRGMGELRGRLEDLVRKAEGMGAVVAADAAKCEDLCDLATSICSVQAKMKELCDAQPQDEEYAALCREAKNECREAQDSCVRCVESNQSK